MARPTKLDFAVVPNGLSVSFQSSKSCWHNALPAPGSEIAMRPGAAMTKGCFRFTGPPFSAVHCDVSPVSPRMSNAPMPSAGEGFATSMEAVGNAQKLAAIFVSPLSVWKAD